MVHYFLLEMFISLNVKPSMKLNNFALKASVYNSFVCEKAMRLHKYKGILFYVLIIMEAVHIK